MDKEKWGQEWVQVYSNIRGQRVEEGKKKKKDKKLRGKLGRNKREKYFFSESESREFFH